MRAESISYNLERDINIDPIISKRDVQTADNVFFEFITKHFEPEIQLLLYCAARRNNPAFDEHVKRLAQANTNWDVFTTLAIRHSLIPLVHKTLNEFSDYLPLEAYSKLKQLTQTNSFNNLYLTNELLRLFAIMESNGIKALPHKGPVLAKLAYGDVSLRQFCDLDILVPQKDVLKTKELFRQINYFPKNSKTDEQDRVFIDSDRPYNYKFISENGRVSVELHWKFTSKYNSFHIDYEHIMDDLMSVEIAGKRISSLRIEDLLVILCQHGSKHFWTRLLWINDIAMLIHNHPQIDWKRAVDFSVKSGAERMFFLGLNLSQILFNTALPKDISSRIEADRKVKKLTNQIVEQTNSNSKNLIQGFEAYVFSCQMRERWRDRVRFSSYQLIPQFNRILASKKNFGGKAEN